MPVQYATMVSYNDLFTKQFEFRYRKTLYSNYVTVFVIRQ